ncbi:tRNA(Met) cytidine acetyltransferase [Halorubrum alkaliphilum]|uniref:tRNA(Met) cytidine acetyltransferase TmcA n=1 Tax=Halorubrum alkaliphilum TaxID=261290 RepID=A0A8T4GGU5_9EURY|nr:tRNA(Met) cytidine acetyltransferase TmcA [Halorubrum alkaliphilum]MBP1923373.1 tRNA(Met) cytidine acetyltransferase [Halorubrum alkaliphilum]
MIRALAADLKREAERTNERRLLVLAGDRDRGVNAAHDVIEAVDAADESVSIVSTGEGFRFDRVGPRGSGDVLGSTREVVVLDCHDRFVPNALGRTVGAVDGGGLLVLLTPSLDEWPDRRDRFDESLAVPPFTLGDVTGRFRRRLVDTLRTHPGVAIASLAAEGVSEHGASGTGSETNGEPSTATIERDGHVEPISRNARPTTTPSRPATATFPPAVYSACLTADQVRAVHALESLATPGSAVVLESDRGRGKSSAAGLAAAALAADGADVLVTAPTYRNAAEVFARARECLGTVDAVDAGDEDHDHAASDDADAASDDAASDDSHLLHVPGSGRVRFAPPAVATDLPDDPDAVIVDEAAALPVRLLDGFLAAPAVAFCTTVHGYEGAGRGFSVRFRDHLLNGEFSVRDVRLDEPIRYAPDDPVESWAARTLALDARPAVPEAVAGTTVDDVRYRTLDPDELLADETLLGEAFGLLVAAHYRTEPNDLARLLDAPNLSARALVTGDRVVAVALLAREGGLPAETRSAMYEGQRVRGNMVPDLLTSQLRDEHAAEPRGIRTVRIATHHALRGRGLGSRLLAEVHDEFADVVEYFSVGFGATPRLLRFWRRAGYRTVHLSTTRNDASGEHSAVMLRPEEPAGVDLLDRHAAAFRDRERDALSDAHRDVDADVVRGALAACPASVSTDLTAAAWRSVVAASFGPGTYEVAPGGFRDLALATMVGDTGPNDEEGVSVDRATPDLAPQAERLLVRKVLQGRPWESVAEELGYVSTTACKRALGDAFRPIVDCYGTDAALAERDRFAEQ